MIRVTVDTTTLVSGFVRRQPPPGRLVQAWEAGLFTLVTSAPLLAEVERTLAKPYVARALTEERRQRYLALLRHEARVVALTVPVAGVASHPEDDVVLSTALSGRAGFVVSSDHRLLGLGLYQELVIVSAAPFLGMLPGLVETEEP